MNILQRFWNFLKQDTFNSWLVSLILIFIIIKFLLFPLLSLITGTQLPLVVVESCSMHHDSNFDNWWDQNGLWYEAQGIEKKEFENYALRNGFTKGDIILVKGIKEPEKGNIIIFIAGTRYPIIHRVISESPLSTKGDNNAEQLSLEQDVDKEKVLGQAVGKIPALGWVKLIFFEAFRPKSERGFC